MWLFYINDVKTEVTEEDFVKLKDAFEWEGSRFLKDSHFYCEFGEIKFVLTKKIKFKNPYENVEINYE